MQQWYNATDPITFAKLKFQTCDMTSFLSEVSPSGVAQAGWEDTIGVPSSPGAQFPQACPLPHWPSRLSAPCPSGS